MSTLTFTIRGDVATKKNSQRGIIRGGRYYRVPSRQHEEWHTRAAWELKAQMRSLTDETMQDYAFPIAKARITMRFWSSTLIRQDLDNKASAALDLLVDCAVLADDSWHVVPELHLFYEGKQKNEARVQIDIEPLQSAR